MPRTLLRSTPSVALLLLLTALPAVAEAKPPLPEEPTLHVLTFGLTDASVHVVRGPRGASPHTVDPFEAGLTKRSGGVAVWVVETQPSPRFGADIRLGGRRYRPESSFDRADHGPRVRVVRQGHHFEEVTDSGVKQRGCEFLGEMHMVDQGTVSITELAYDADECLMLVEVTVSDARPSEDTKLADREETSSESVVGSQSADEKYRLHFSRFKAQTRSQVRELAYPIIPATSQVKAWVQLNSLTSANLGYVDSWLAGTGWKKISFSWYKRFNSSFAYSSVYAKYRNGVFCNALSPSVWPASRTYGKHWPTRVYGYQNTLSARYSTNTSKYGGCSWLLRTNKTTSFWWL